MGVMKELGDKVRDTYLRAGVGLRHPHTIGPLWLGEKALNISAPIAGVLSMGANPQGSIIERAVQGPYEVGKGLYQVTSAFASNQGVRDFAGDTLSRMATLAGNAGENVFGNGALETAGIAVGVYAGLRTLGALLGLKKDSKMNDYMGGPVHSTH